jgi:hypothetical protein
MKKPIRILSFFLIITLLGLFGTINVLGEILSISTEVEITGQENTSWNSSEGVYDGNGDATFTSTITSDDYNELAGMTVSSSVYNSQGIATNPDLVSISSIETVSESVYGAVYKATVTSDFDNLDFDDYTYNLGLLDGATNIGSDSKDFNVNSPYNVPEDITITDGYVSNGSLNIDWTIGFPEYFEYYNIEYSCDELSIPEYLYNIGIFYDEYNTLSDDFLDEAPYRYQVARMYLRLLGLEAEAITYAGIINFNDVSSLNDEDKAMLAYLNDNPELGFTGYPDGSFGVYNTVSAQELYKILLTAMGYIQGTDYTWPDVFAFAASRGLTALSGINVIDNENLATGIYEALKAENDKLSNALVNNGKLDANKVNVNRNAYSSTVIASNTVTTATITLPSGYENRNLWTVRITANTSIKMLAKSKLESIGEIEISGTINLPVGVTADSNMEFDVYLHSLMDEIDQNDDYITSTTVYIIQNSSEASYSITIPIDKRSEKNYVYYSLSDSQNKYETTGYFNGSTTVMDKSSANPISTLLPIDITGIDMSVNAKSNLISGTISLPNGDIAPEGGIDVEITVMGIDGSNKSCGRFKSFTIPANLTSIDYSIDISDCIYPQYHIYYTLEDNNNYVYSGYYSKEKTTPYNELKTLFTYNEAITERKDIELIAGRKVTGKVSLPDNISADESFECYVQIRKGFSISNTYVYRCVTDLLLFEIDDKEKEFLLIVPMEFNDAYVEYELYNTTNFLQNGYYTGDTSSYYSYDREKLYLNKNVNDINIELKKAVKLSGKLKVDASLKPVDEIWDGYVKYKLDNNTDNFYSYAFYSFDNFTLDSGKNEYDFTIYVPENMANGYLYYTLSHSSGVLKQGYYSSLGTVMKKEEAHLFDAHTTDKNDLDFNIIKASTVSGIVKLPDNDVAPGGGKEVRIEIVGTDSNASTWEESGSCTVTIPESENFIAFSMDLDKQETSKYFYRYYLADDDTYLKYGYYNENKTVPLKEDCTLISLNEIKTGNYELELIKGTKIAGIFKLPDEEVLGNDCNVDLIATYEINGIYNSTSRSYTLNACENAFVYNLILPTEAENVELRYIFNNQAQYFMYGYYTGTVNTYNQNDSIEIDISNGDMQDIIFIAVKTAKLSGRINKNSIEVPQGETWRGSVYYKVGNNYWYDSFSLTSSNDYYDYEIYVPQNIADGYIYYYFYENSSVYKKGYYTSQGTVLDLNSAEHFDISDNDIPNLDLELLLAPSVSGTIRLPQNEVAPAGGLEIELTLSGESDNGYLQTSNQCTVIIPENQNSIDFEISNGNADYDDYTLKYTLDDSNSFVKEGYYNISETTPYQDNYSVFSIGNQGVELIDMQILQGTKLSGTLSLPDNETADSNFRIRVRIEEDVTINGKEVYYSTYRDYDFIKGSSEIEYTVIVPSDMDETAIRFNLYNQSEYMGLSYYAGEKTTYSYYKRIYLDLTNGDKENIDTTLTRAVKISGQISADIIDIPENGNLRGNIWYKTDNDTPLNQDDDYVMNYYFELIKNNNVCEYVMTVPENLKNGYLYYNLNGYNDVLDIGYYTQNGTVPAKNSSVYFDVGINDIPDMDLKILQTSKVSGTIKLPDNELAPAGGKEVSVCLYGVNEYGGLESINSKSITIPETQNSIEYSIAVNNQGYDNYTVGYKIDDDTYYEEGFYNQVKTVFKREEHTSLTLEEITTTDINLMLIKGVKVSGSFELPVGEVAENDINMEICVPYYTDVSEPAVYEYYKLKAGENKLDYYVILPATASKAIVRCILNSKTQYLQWNYYSDTGTVRKRENATWFDLNGSDKTNINIEAKKGIKITGRINSEGLSIPSGETWRGTVFYQSDGGTPGDSSDDYDSHDGIFNLTSDKKYYDYTFVVPENQAGGYLYYNMFDYSNILQTCYYCSDGTTNNYDLKEIFDVGTEDVEGYNLEFIQGIPVSGKVILPDNEVASSDILNLRMKLYSSDTGFSIGDYINLHQGHSFVNYNLSIPKGSTGKFYITVCSDEDNPYSDSPVYEINVIDDNTPIVQDLVLTKPQIRGQIRKPDDSGGIRGYLNLYDENNKYLKHISTDSQGNFKIGALDEGNYRIVASPYYDDSWKYIESDAVDITIPYTGSDLKIFLKAPFLTGTVYNADGTEATDGWIEVVQYTNGYREYIESNSIRQGKYAIGNLPDGTYSIKARAYSNDNKNNCDSEEVEFTVTGGVASSSTIDLHFVGPQLTGNVLKPDGTNAKYGYIRVNDEIGEYVTDVSVSRSGAFNIAGLSDGNYEMIAYPDWNSKYSPSLPYSFSISGGQYAGNNPEIYLSQAQLEILVQDPDSNPEQDARVEVRGSDGRWVLSKGANTSGKAYIGGLSDGQYKITAYPSWSNADCVKSNEITVVIENGTFLGGTLSISLNRPQITGTVKKPDGTTTDRAYLQVYTVTGRWITSVDVKNNGSFAIGALQDGTYKIKAQPYSDEDLCPSDDIAVTIKDGAYGPSSLVIILKNPQITGYVYGPVGTADENNKMRYGYIYIYKQNGDFVAYSHVSREGKFKLTDIEDGNYKLKAWPDGNSQYVESDYINFKVQNGVSTGGTLAVNLMTASINGTVYDPSGQNPQKYGWIEIKEEDTGYWVDGTSIDGNGNFRIGKLDAGKYTLIAYPDWRSEYSRSKETVIEIDNNGDCIDPGSPVSIKLSAIQLSGKVTKANGDSPGYSGWLSVYKVDANGSKWVRGKHYDDDGIFNLGGLDDGNYKITAYPHDGEGVQSDEYDFDIVSGELAGDELTIALNSTQITGVVKGPDGEKTSWGYVEIRDENNNYITGRGTNRDGEFSLGGLSDGDYKLIAYPDYGSNFIKSLPVDIEIIGEEYSGNPLTVNLRDAEITGTVKGPNGEDISGGWVEVYSAGKQWIATFSVNSQGAFPLGGLDTGNYKIKAFASHNSEFADSEFYNIKIKEEAGVKSVEPSPLILNLSEPTITGIVYLPGDINENNTAGSGWIEVGDENENWLLSAPINNDGTFKLPKLDAGNYVIQAFPDADSGNAASNIINLEIKPGNSGYVPDPLELQFNE